MKSKIGAAAIATVMLVSGAASAADGQAAWAGFNVGVSGGSHQTGSKAINIGGSNLIRISQGPSLGVPNFISVDRDQTIGSLFVGYNWRSGAFVYGLEADYTFTDLDGKSRISRFGNNVITTASASVENLMTVRGRLGYVPAERWLLAATAGIAMGKVEMRNNIDEFNGLGRQFAARRSETKTGWSAGVEAGYAFTNNLMMRADYNHYDLGNARSGRGTQSNPASATEYADYGSIQMAGDSYRLSLLYRF